MKKYIRVLVLFLSFTAVSILHVYPNSPFNRLADDAFKSKIHYVNVLSNGDDALLARLHLIRKARKSIHIQTFIWSIDETSRFVVYELIQAAKRGVKVKIIIDYFTLPKNPNLIAFIVTAHPNLEVKFYNPVSKSIVSSKPAWFKKVLFDFRGLNQRMHNKAFIVDGKFGITGGRNYENDYYDRGVERNFKDCDVLVIGPVVKEITNSFKEYWDYPLSVSGGDMRDVQKLIKRGGYEKYSSRESFVFGSLFEGLEEAEADEEVLKQRLINTSYRVKGVKFVVDKPGKNSRIGKYKTTPSTNELYKFLRGAEKSIVMQTPYLIIGGKGTKYFKKLAKDKPNVEFLLSSNSLASADHIHAYAFSYKNKKKYLKSFRWQIFELKLLPEDLDLMISPINKQNRSKDYITCVHSKIYVVDGKKTWIGSFNLDPRSANLNTESGIIIDDEKLARDTERDIRRDMASRNSWAIGKCKQLPVISQFSGLLANVIKLIPVIDIWPFTYSGSFELKPGKEAVPFFHKDFYGNYKYVGPFPKVQMTEKEIKTRLIKAFLGPMQPLI